jgi:hypothetical protein
VSRICAHDSMMLSLFMPYDTKRNSPGVLKATSIHMSRRYAVSKSPPEQYFAQQ